MSNTATTPTTPAVRKFLAEHATSVEYSHPQYLKFTARTGKQVAIFVKSNGSLDNAYVISSSGDFGPAASSLKALAQRIA